MGRTCLLAWKNKSDSLREEESGEDNVRCFWNLVSSLQEWHGLCKAAQKQKRGCLKMERLQVPPLFLEDYKVNLSCYQHLNKQMQK